MTPRQYLLSEPMVVVYEIVNMCIEISLPSILACSTTFGGADNGADGGLSTGVDALNSLCGRTTGSPACELMCLVSI